MTKHTPGPWVCTGFHVRLPDDTLIAYCDATDLPGPKKDWANREDQVRANARLIGAAPDLLAAAERAAELLSEIMSYNELADDVDAVLAPLVAAIAKAEDK